MSNSIFISGGEGGCLAAQQLWAKAVLDEVIPQGMPCALLDYPDHSNVGDSAIWLGEMVYCKITNRHIDYVSSLRSYSESVLRKAMPKGVVLIHGGGNFGGLWLPHQRHRESVLNALRDYKVIQLPQTLFFGDDRACFDRTAALIRQHPDFTLLVRDRQSEALGLRLGARTLLCPDSAVFLAGTLHRALPEVDFYGLTRTDKERSGGDWPPPPDRYTVDFGDWLEVHQHPITGYLSMLQRRAHGRFGHQWWFQRALLQAFNVMARARVARGVRQLSRGRVVVTDRLHAHLLSLLLGIPHVVLDNHYGKIHGYMDCWGDGGNTRCGETEQVWQAAVDQLPR